MGTEGHCTGLGKEMGIVRIRGDSGEAEGVAEMVGGEVVAARCGVGAAYVSAESEVRFLLLFVVFEFLTRPFCRQFNKDKIRVLPQLQLFSNLVLGRVVSSILPLSSRCSPHSWFSLSRSTLSPLLPSPTLLQPTTSRTGSRSRG
jgi:hypothetical protein